MIRFKPRRNRRRRDFSTDAHHAPAVVRQLSQAYRKQPTPRWHRWGWYSLGFIILGALVAAVYSPLFRIRNVIVSHVPSRTTEERLKQLVVDSLSRSQFYILPGDNLLFFSPARARAKLAQEFYVDHLSFSRSWPNVLRVTLADQVVVAEWQTSEKHFLVDRRGVLVQELGTVTESLTLPVVREPVEVKSKLGNSVTTAQVMSFIDALNRAWQNVLPEHSLAYIAFDQSAVPTLEFHAQDGWFAKVSMQADSLKQVDAIKRLVVEQLKGNVTNLLYVDVRFGSQLSYKLK